VRAWEVVERLMASPHRGSGSAYERRAAEDLAALLRERGWRVAVESFRAPAATLYDGPVIIALWLLVAFLVAEARPLLGALLAWAALVPLLGELLGRPWNLDLVLPASLSSQNVFAMPPGRAGPTLVLAAHLDTQRGTWFFHPRLRPRLRLLFALPYLGLFGLPLALTGRALGLPLERAAAVLAGLLVLVVLGFVVVRGSGGFVPGANDNASGVAVALTVALDLAEAFPDQGVGLLLTGAEEVGERGMLAFLRRHGFAAAPVLVNVDNVGGGRLRYLSGEGMLLPLRYPAWLVRRAADFAKRHPDRLAAGFPLLLPTDAQWHAARGRAAITFIGQEDGGAIPNYHWHDDTLDKMNPDELERRRETIRMFCAEILREEGCRDGEGGGHLRLRRAGGGGLPGLR
jgi:hypothetical protein